MKCEICQAEIPENEKVCPACGALVAEAPVAEAPAKEAKAAPAKNEGKTMGIVGMCLGIGAIVLLVLGFLGGCCTMGITVPVGAIIAFILAVVALILCIKAKSKSKKSGHGNVCAIIGIILSLITLIVVALITIVVLVLFLIYGGLIFAEIAAIFSQGMMY